MFFPTPRQVNKRSGRLQLDANVEILVPELASDSDLFLASFLSADLADQYGIPLENILRARLDPDS